ncbi:hypothetical protein MAR_036921 [Mya arenaria]|uniref:Uncharacterized protein n=1 Tax=Mya arenaria TaxID=6604 RepID=A0ABY7FNS7_MYAAR|nr:hypothetical protein MAR_036921 [Mya arenaria]
MEGLLSAREIESTTTGKPDRRRRFPRPNLVYPRSARAQDADQEVIDTSIGLRRQGNAIALRNLNLLSSFDLSVLLLITPDLLSSFYLPVLFLFTPDMLSTFDLQIM